METILNPTTLPEVERLVHELYRPNRPETISRIQDILQGVQKSPEGWQIAQGLSARPGDNVKFFAALTYTIKLNTENLPDEGAVSVLRRLISWLITALRDGTGRFVLTKLCNTLVTHFIHYSHTWPRCVRHLSHCLQTRTSVPFGHALDNPPIENLVQSLDVNDVFAMVWFTQYLANEIGRIDTKSTKYISLHERLLSNAGDSVLFITRGISTSEYGSISPLAVESISCVQAWLQYAQRNPKQPLVQQLRTLIQPVINCLPNEELYQNAMELFTEVLEDWPTFFLSDHYESLYSVFESDWGADKYFRVLRSDTHEDEVRFGLFMLAFGNTQLAELVDTTNTRAQHFLSRLVPLLKADGYPGVDDRIFVPALEFWGSFTEYLVDRLFEEPQRQMDWTMPPLMQVMHAIGESWQKIRYPSIGIYNSWDSSEKTGFADARKDVADFLQSVFPIVGKQLISLFAEAMMQALECSDWAALEAAAFCLGALSDYVMDGTSCDDILTKLFRSPLFEVLHQGQNVVPIRARQTCLSVIERYSEYFNSHAAFLPAALNLLFSAVGDRHLAMPSSKSIYTLCSSCRSLLTSEVDAFLEQYGSLRDSELDSLAEERVLGAIASIIQAIPDESRKAGAFQRLLAMAGVDVENSLRLSSHGESLLTPDNPMVVRAYDLNQRPATPMSAPEIALQLAIRALRCLCSIAKGLQAPSDAPVDLEAEDASAQVPTSTTLNQTHVEIMRILVQLKETFSSNSEVVDVICSILRAGFSETEPGPFVLPPQMVTEFLTSRWQNRVATVVNTASIFVTSLSSGAQRKYVGEVLGHLLPWVFGLLHQLPEPEQDPELSQYGLEFSQRAMARRPEILISQPANMLEFLFMFAMKLLNGNEPLPKAAAAEFWTTFITLKTDDQNTQTMVNNAMTYLGPKLSESLIQNIGGKASRSELDKLSDPLKKLVVQHVSARDWLHAALYDPTFPSDNVSREDKILFLKKIISLRGQRATNQVVRDFWLACRGSSFAYAA
ncbi:ARM repeat-containing protein [Hypoxylon sp. NC1633]|nr:ARM repeat-containing protein [Hypoxylon sp. NC1633]